MQCQAKDYVAESPLRSTVLPAPGDEGLDDPIGSYSTKQNILDLNTATKINSIYYYTSISKAFPELKKTTRVSWLLQIPKYDNHVIIRTTPYVNHKKII